MPNYFNLGYGVRVAAQQPVDGDRYVADTLAARDSLIGSLREYEGLQVYVKENKKLYILLDPVAPLWAEIGEGSGPSPGTDISYPVAQIAHGFVLGDVIAAKDPEYVYANAIDETATGIGVVIEVVDANNFVFTDTGDIPFTKFGLTKGTNYYLDIINGGVTATEPGDYKQIIFQAAGSSTAIMVVGDMYVLGVETGAPSPGVTISPFEARVSADFGSDASAEIGSYDKPFRTITAASLACRTAVVSDNNLAGKYVINVEVGTYIDEENLAFAGTLNLNGGVTVYGDNATTTFDINNVAFSGLSDQIFYVQGVGILRNISFAHADQSQQHTFVLKCDFLQFRAMEIASRFVLDAVFTRFTNDGDIYLVDNVNINIGNVFVDAGVDVSPFIIHPADTPGTLVNNASSIHFDSVTVADTGRLYVTKFTPETFERHSLNVSMNAGEGDIVMMFNTTNWSSIEGDMVLNYRYTLLHDNPINSDTSSTKFHVSGNTVLTIDANLTNYGYLQRGLLIASNGDSIVNANLDYTSYSSQRTLYLDVKLNGKLTIDGIITAASSGSEEGIYLYTPNEAPYDDLDNAGNIYFKNVVLRNMNDFIGGLALWCWSGAFHNLTILGTFAIEGNWSTEKHGNISYTYSTILPTSADVTRELTVATAGQLVFPAMYKLIDDQLLVIMNGFVLGGDDYSITATDLTLGLAAFVDDEITLISSDATPNVYPMTEWATTSPTSALSVVIPPITFVSAPTDPTINGALTGPDTAGDGVLYKGIPSGLEAESYLSYSILQDASKTVQLISVRFAARIENIADEFVFVKVRASNDNFVSFWESPAYEFISTGYTTKEWPLSARLFSPDKNTSVGIQIRIVIFTAVANIDQGILFNNFTLKGYHKLT